MGELEFVEFLYKKLKKKFKDCTLSKYESLIYKVTVEKESDKNSLEYFPQEPKDPKRGSYAFQTDLLIKRDNLPLVVIEAKWESITTHNILTYSTKALKHKDIYPHIQYGLIIGGDIDFLPRRFFIHNQGFDFAFVMQKPENDKQLNTFINIIKQQIECSLEHLKILQKDKKFKIFNTVTEYK